YFGGTPLSALPTALSVTSPDAAMLKAEERFEDRLQDELERMVDLAKGGSFSLFQLGRVVGPPLSAPCTTRSRIAGIVIEVGPEVKIDDSGFTLVNRLGDSVYRFLRSPFRSVSIRSRLKVSERMRTLLPPSFGISFFRTGMGRYVFLTSSS